MSWLKRLLGSPHIPPPAVTPAVDAGWTIKGEQNHIDRPPSCQFDNFSVQITGNSNRVEIGQNVILSNSRIIIAGDRHRVRLADHVQLRNTTLWFEDSDCLIDIGQQTTSEGVGFAVTEPGSKIIVGKDCMFSYDIDIRTGDSHSILDAATGQRINFAQDVVLGDRVWVGAHSIILKGVTLAPNTVVGTGAVVVRSESQPNVILAGNPAKIIKQGTDWHRARLPRDPS